MAVGCALPLLLMQRLSHLIRRLASTYDGEVVATVRAIERTLAAEGCDWHDLANQLAGPGPVRPNGPPPLQQMASWLDQRQNLSQWEQKFVPSVLRQLCAGANLTDKQDQALRRCYAKHGGPGL